MIYLYIVLSFLILNLQLTAFGQTSPAPSTSTAPAPTSIHSRSPRFVGFYGYSYRSFVGLPNGGPIALTNGEMQMHILALKYNLNDRFGLRMGTAYLAHTFNFTDRRPGQTPNSSAFVEGFSDLRVSTIYTYLKDRTKSLDFTLGVNLPTAPILKDDFGRPLPPQEQFSSGTYDILMTINSSQNLDSWSFTEKLDGIMHTGENSSGYRLGDQLGFTASASYAITPYLTPTISARYTDRKDLSVNHYWKPNRANVRFGSGWEGVVALRSGFALRDDHRLRFGLEVGAPVYRSSRTNQDIIGETQWYASTNLTASY